MVKYFLSKGSLWLLLFSAVVKLSAQNVTDNKTDSLQYMSYDAFFEELENRYSIHVFYKNEWFEHKKINRAFAELKLEDALLSVKRLSSLSYITVDDHAYVFLPYQTSILRNSPKDQAEISIIGNPNDFGRFSKATVTGRITDGKTGESLAGATITIEKLKIAKSTDDKGNFSMTIPVGEYVVKLSYIGYEDNSREIKLVSNGSISFELFEKSVKINEVIISAEKAAYNVNNTQMSVLRMDAKTIKELPVSLGETDIIRSMSLMPGIQTSGEFGTGFNVRGSSVDQNLVLIEDVPLFNSSHLFGLNSAINADDVLNVTLLKGGIPARYGERASSIMDIRLGVENVRKVKAMGGIGLLNSRLSIVVPMFKNKATLMVGARSSYSNWLLHKLPDYDLKNSSASFYDFNALYSIYLNQHNKITVFGYYSQDKFNFNKNIHYVYSNTLASLKWTHLFNRSLTSTCLTGISLYNYNVNEMDTLHRTEAYQINIRAQYNNLKVNFAWVPTNNHAFDFGINAVLYQIFPGQELPFGQESIIKPVQVQPEKGLEMALYGGDNVTVTPKLSAELGCRYVHYLSLGPGSVLTFRPGFPKSLETIMDTIRFKNNQIIQPFSSLEPRIALRFKIDNLSSVKFSYGRITQFITLLSNSTVMAPSDSWKLSTVNLNPLISDQVSLGYFRNFNNNGYESSMEIYYKQLQNVIEYKNGTQILLNEHIEADIINARGKNYGAEFFIKKNIGTFTGWLSYTFSRSYVRTTSNSIFEQINNNRYYPSSYDRPHNIELIANYHVSKRWRFSGTFTYNTGRPVTLPELSFPYSANQLFYYSHPGVFIGTKLVYYSDRNKYRLPDYHRLDLAITFDENLRLKRMWKGSWTLSVINVYARKNIYSVFYAKADPKDIGNTGETELYMMYIIGIPLPTLTYNFTF